MAKILLVEDDNNLREIYEARLQAEGYTIVSAHDGEEALVVAKDQKPDLVISDVMMPKISGFEMLDIMRNTDGLKDTKVIMLTALGQNDDQQRADRLGADRYLVKSQVTLEDIVKVAQDLLAPSPAAATPSTVIPVTPADSTSVPPIVPIPPTEPILPAAPQLSQPASTVTPLTVTMPVTTEPVAAPMAETPDLNAPVAVTITPPEPTLPLAENPVDTTVSSPTNLPEPVVNQSTFDPATTVAAPTTTETAPSISQSADDEAVQVENQIENFVATVNTTPEEVNPPSAADLSQPTDTVQPSETGSVAPDMNPAVAVATAAAPTDYGQLPITDTPTESAGQQAAELPPVTQVMDNSSTTAVIQPDLNTIVSAPAVDADAPISPSAIVAHKKVIQPPEDSAKPDLAALLAREEGQIVPETNGVDPTQVAEVPPTVAPAPAEPQQPAIVTQPLAPAPSDQPTVPGQDFNNIAL